MKGKNKLPDIIECHKREYAFESSWGGGLSSSALLTGIVKSVLKIRGRE